MTLLLPVVLFPFLGIMDGKAVDSTYFNHVIFMFIVTGFIITLAMERWNLHKRIALKILMFTGVSPGRILHGFMIASAFLSMWISNAATAMMMIPTLISIISKLEESVGKKKVSKYIVGLLLGVAYGASIGGIATLVGMPPNLSFAGIFHIYFPDTPEISFATWFIFALPISITMFMITWAFLYFILKQKKGTWININRQTFKHQLSLLGPAGLVEKVFFIVFILVAFLRLFRSDLDFGIITIPGWVEIFPKSDYINDGTIGILMVVLLFVLPSKKEGPHRIMNWQTATKIQWHIVLFFRGGFALHQGTRNRGCLRGLANN